MVTATVAVAVRVIPVAVVRRRPVRGTIGNRRTRQLLAPLRAQGLPPTRTTTRIPGNEKDLDPPDTVVVVVGSGDPVHRPQIHGHRKKGRKDRRRHTRPLQPVEGDKLQVLGLTHRLQAEPAGGRRRHHGHQPPRRQAATGEYRHTEERPATIRIRTTTRSGFEN